MCWIDFKKAYDMVPHEWILIVMKTYGIAENIVHFIQKTMNSWNVWLHHKGIKLANIKIKRGIFQGDSLSPILFIMSLFPLSHVILNNELGYKMKLTKPTKENGSDKIRINHLLYMDDIKLYAESPQQLQRLINAVKDYSDSMKMKFGLEKCKIVDVVNGRLNDDCSNNFEFSNGDSIQTLKLESDSYKYLGILQLNDLKQAEMKEQVRKEYKKRVRAILKSQLNGRNKIDAINSLAIPVVRYSGGLLKWNQLELQEMDRKTRKLLTIHRGLAKRSDVDRIYARRMDGGRGLLSVQESIILEEKSIQQYRRKSTQAIIHLEENEDGSSDGTQSVMKTMRKENWMNKVLHGQYIRQLDRDIDEKLTFQWLMRGELNIETEGFLCAAQEQAIHTRAIGNHIYGTTASDKCRLCGNSSETVMHIAAECSTIAQTDYLERHNKVARYVHWKLLKMNGVELNKWHEHDPQKVYENESVKLLWDFNIFTDKKISARRPDIIMVLKNIGSGFIIDVNCPNDRNVRKNEIEKAVKYTELKIELERIWGMHFQVIPLVIGALGAISTKFTQFANLLGLNEDDTGKLQNFVIQATCHILRKYVTQSGIETVV